MSLVLVGGQLLKTSLFDFPENDRRIAWNDGCGAGRVAVPFVFRSDILGVR